MYAQLNNMEKIIEKLNNLHERSRTYPDLPIDRDLHKLLCNRDTLALAYNKIKSRPGNMTPGINPETLDGISAETLDRIALSLRTEQFQFQAGRRIQIPKPSGGTRPLTMASPRDKIVQEAMRMILDAI